jgi:hypothetical protein
VGPEAVDKRPQGGEDPDLWTVVGDGHRHLMAMLDSIVTMDESAVSFHLLETKM